MDSSVSPPMDEYKARVAKASVTLVRRVLADRGWRPARLAEELVVHPDLVRRWLRGERRPQLDDMVHMCDMLGASLDELLGMKEDEGVELSPTQMQELADMTAASLLRSLSDVIGTAAARLGEPVRPGLAMLKDHQDSLSPRARQALERLMTRDEQGDASYRRRA